MRLSILITVLAILCISGCKQYRPKATGGFGEAVVVMDSSQWNSQTAEAIRETYGGGIYTLPTVEPLMDLSFRDFNNNSQLEHLRKNKNLIIAAPITDSTNTAKFIQALLGKNVKNQVRAGNDFAFPLQNQWYNDQWAIILTSTSDSSLARKILNAKKTLANQLVDKELKRWQSNIYEKGEKTGVEDSLWAHHGWKMRIEHDWNKDIDTTYANDGKTNHLVTMRRILTNNDRWFFAWWTDDAPPLNAISPDWINAKRDSILEHYFRGTRDSSYVTTDYKHRPVITDTLKVDQHPAFETMGIWKMTHDAMGGPFVNMTIYDRQQGRLFMLEFVQFAPKYHKRRFVRQFQAMLRTFKSDSTWNASQKKKAVGGGE